MPLQLRVVQEPLPAVLNGTDVLPLSVRHQVLPHRRRVLEDFAAIVHMTGVNFVSFAFFWSSFPRSAHAHHVLFRQLALQLFSHLLINLV